MIKSIDRRSFLKSSTLLGALAVSSPLALIAPSRAWAVELASLSQPTADALLVFSRHLFPHDSMEDAVYALVVKDLDAAAKADPAAQQLLEDGVKQLDQLSAGPWLALHKTEQFAVVEKLEGTDFFEKVRSTCIVSLYNNELAFAHFGYEGEAYSKGGYLNRGFQDIDWLPDPPADASPSKA